MKGILDRFDGKFRLATKEERDELRARVRLALPARRSPLTRPATAEDVRRPAIFELGGKPADEASHVAAPESGRKKERPPRGLIVQAEIGPDGKVTYGVTFATPSAVLASEVESIDPARFMKK